MKKPALQIGRLCVSPPIVQAPMCALTTLSMRTLSEEQGCGLTVTEFIPAAGLVAKQAVARKRLTPNSNGRPFGVQIYGREPEAMRAAAAIAVEHGAALVDINMGCPAKTVTGGHCGAALMREPALAADIVRAVHDGCAGAAAVTVKMRTGWDGSRLNAPDLARRLVDAGAMAITVHGRTREQRFTGAVNFDVVAEVKQKVSVPVLVNGDIVDVPSLERALHATGADGAMIGRGALGNPWIFSLYRAWWAGLALPSPPSATDRVRMYWRHLQLYLNSNDEERAVLEMRKFAGWYLKPEAEIAPLIPEINRRTNIATIYDLIATHL